MKVIFYKIMSYYSNNHPQYNRENPNEIYIIPQEPSNYNGYHDRESDGKPNYKKGQFYA